MYNVPGDLYDAFSCGPEIFEAVLAGCTPEEARSARGGDEGWSVVEVVCHLRDAEERALARTIAMRDQDNPYLEPYDQDAWAVERNYAAENLNSAFAAFVGFRNEHLAVLKALAPEDWQRPGVHAEYGEISISGQALHMVAHDSQHAAQIARQLSSIRK